ncbi:phosphate/phosphite/phosphonate ABC transporter substrate-binding protein [Marinicella sp. W31]|uniref:phosphate/phosphite/phosphonate ABC transporter substrate-binding protein n=1 Tax=Marinicella sp. W31 TaxID=3023713 RepID=UPI0037570551
MRKLTIFAVLIQLLSTSAFSQTINLAIEANYPPDQAALVYEPIRDYLSKKTGMNVELDVQENYYFYWREARNSSAQFTLDAPHIAAYRIEEQGYIPLARIQENTSYHLISTEEKPDSQNLNQFLVGKRVVMLPNPSLASMLFDEWFTDLFMQPNKIVSALSWDDAIEQVFSQQAHAAIIPQWLFEQYPNFVSLKESKAYPGLTFLAAPTVSERNREAFKTAVLNLGQDQESFGILAELFTEGFQEVDIKDYEGLADMLKALLY